MAIARPYSPSDRHSGQFLGTLTLRDGGHKVQHADEHLEIAKYGDQAVNMAAVLPF